MENIGLITLLMSDVALLETIKKFEAVANDCEQFPDSQEAWKHNQTERNAIYNVLLATLQERINGRPTL